MATFTDAIRTSALQTVVNTTNKWVSLHTADPGTTGASEVSGGTYARVSVTWGSWTSGSIVGAQATINVPAGVTVAYWGVNSAATGSAFIAGGALTASESYTGAGTYLLTLTFTD